MHYAKLSLVLLLLAGCGVPRPNTDICIVSAFADKPKSLVCFNLEKDYDKDGNLKPGAQPSIRPVERLDEINRYFCTDPDGWANLMAYVQKLRDRTQTNTGVSR